MTMTQARFLAAVFFGVFATHLQAAQPTWNRVPGAPCLRDFDLGGPGNAGPEIWGLACARDSNGNSDIVHRLTPTSGWEAVGGRGNWIAAGPQIAAVITTFARSVYTWNRNGRFWEVLPGGPDCIRRVATDVANGVWVRDCSAESLLWVWGVDFGGVNPHWTTSTNQFPGPGIAVYVEVAPPYPTANTNGFGQPWIINYNGGSTFQVYKSNGSGRGWSPVGTGITPSCVNSLGLGGSGLQSADAWITDCTPTGNGYRVLHLGPPLAPLWSVVDSPGMARIKVDRAFDIPFAIDNNGALWNYCVPRTLSCG
jgi:hypothetical protein